MSKKLLRGREEQQDISLTVEAIAAQACPAAVRELQALLTATSTPSAGPRLHGNTCFPFLLRELQELTQALKPL